MVQKKCKINKMKKEPKADSKNRRSCSGEPLPLSQQVSLKDIYERGKRQAWIVLVPLLDVFILNISLVAWYVIDISKHHLQPLPFLPTISEL